MCTLFFTVHGHYTVVFKMGHLKRYGIDQNIRTSDNQNFMKIWLSPFSKSEGTIVVKELRRLPLIILLDNNNQSIKIEM